MNRTSDKRERLIAAARTLIQQNGYRHTSLADIARASGVPLGNVYYWFRTKDDLAAAVIDEHHAAHRAMLDEIDRSHDDPLQRMSALLDVLDTGAEDTAKHGCPIGSLCLELHKGGEDAGLPSRADAILRMQLDWFTAQFERLGARDPRVLARHVVAHLQGASLLATTLGDAGVLREATGHLRQWLKARAG